jgi:hypothetical protein
MTNRLMVVEWQDAGREARSPSDPAYPDGIDLDFSQGAAPACSTPLPYPAPRCGVWLVSCSECGLRVVITAAGRRDDPREVKLACKRKLH